MHAARDDGTVLLESIVAMMIITIIMSAVGAEFLTVTIDSNHQRAEQGAVQVASSAIEQIRAVRPSDLVDGRDAASVTAQFASGNANAAVTNWLQMDQVSDPSASSGSGATATIPTSPVSQQPASVSYQVTSYLGTCVIRVTGSTACVKAAAAAGAQSLLYLRAVVAVSWKGAGCGSTPCTYVTSTLVSTAADPAFRATTYQMLVASVPAQTSTVSTALTPVDLNKFVSGGSGSYTWNDTSAPSLPNGLTVSAKGIVTGTPTATGSSTATLTITDWPAGTSTTASFTWSVVTKPVISTPGNQTTTVGAAVSLQVNATCLNTPCTYALTGAPTGLSISNTGLITGTVAGAAQTYNAVTVTVTDAAGASASTAAFAWTVVAKAIVAAPPNQTDTIGDSVTVALAPSCSNAPCSYVLNNGPPGLSVSSAGVINGIVGGAALIYSGVTITAKDASGVTSTTAGFTWTVFAKPTITAPSNQVNSLGASVNVALTTSCANAPCTYVLNNGPPSLSITNAGVITGIVAGSAQNYLGVTATVTDADGATATTSGFTWTVYARPTVGSPGNQTVSVGTYVYFALSTSCPNSPCSYTVTSGPGGLSISNTGVVTGTVSGPPAVYSNVSVTVTDANGATGTSGTFTLTVTAAPTITSPGNQTSTVGATVNLSLSTSCANTPCSYVLTNGPPGLSVSNTGVITGSPTTVGTSSNVSVTVTDATNVTATTAAFTWIVLSAPTITTPGNQTSTVNTSVSLQVTSSCSNTPCSYTLTGAPAGLSINSSGLITGNPTTAGTSSAVTITVRDSNGASTTTGSFAWTILAAPTITTPANQSSTVGTAVSLQVTASCPNTPCSYTLTGAPAGLSINNSGLITGNPTTVGTSNAVTVTIRDSNGATATTSTFTWSVVAGPTITTPGNQTTTVGTAVSLQVTSSCPNTPCSYTISGQPAGLTINNSGLITGTPTTVGPSPSVTVTIRDSNGATTSGTFTWTIVARPTITTPSNQVSTVSTPVSLQITNSCPNTPCSYTLTNGPPGLSINASGLITGSPTTVGTLSNVTVSVRDSNNVSATTGNFTWTIVAKPTVTAPANQTSTVGTTVNLALTTSCPNPTCTYMLNNGPTGLTVNNSGVITGTIGGSAQTYANVTVTVTDASGATATSAVFSWTVRAAPTITTPANQTTTVNTAVSLQVNATCPNTPCTYGISGQPAGLTINSSSGLITGTPTTIGNSTAVSVTVRDNNGVVTVSNNFSWAVVAAPTITTPGNQTGTVGANVSLQVTNSCPNTTCTYTLTGAPAGLSINGSGLITGSPTTVGTSNAVTVTVKDSNNVSATTGTFTWTVLAAPTITTPGNQTTTVGTAVNLQVTSSCSNTPCSYTLINGPAGLSINSSGLITGTPTTVANYNVTVRVTDNSSVSTTTGTFSWSIVARPTVSAPPNQTSTVGATINLALSTTCPNPTCRYTLVNGPPGLTISNIGVITGTIGGTAQTYSSVTVSVTDANGATASSTAFSWTVLPTIVLTTGSQTTTVGTPVSLTLTASGGDAGPYSYSLTSGSLPAGLTLSAAGVITGTPTTPGSYSAQLKVFDSSGTRFGTGSLSWTINYPPLVANNPGPQTSTLNAPINPTLQLTASGGSGNYVWSDASPRSLPAGLNISAGGLVTGTPTALGSSTVTLTLTDAPAGSSRTVSFTWTIVARPTVTSPGNRTNSLGATVNLALTTSCPNTPCSYVLNNGPSGLSVTSAGVITGTIGGSAQTYANVSVTVTDGDNVTASTAVFSWTVLAKPTVTAPANQSDTLGSTVNIALSTTCPNSPCSYVLNNGPGGLSISSTGVITGTITGSAQTYSNVTVTVTDANAVTATSAAFSWTVLARPTITAPANQSDTIGTSVSVSPPRTCANTPCTYTLANAPTGLSITSAGVITGTIGGSAQTYSNVTVTITDADSISATSATFTWTVVAKPTITAPANRTDTVGTGVSLTLTKTCPNTPCNYTLNNGPPGLSITSAGVITGTIGGSPQTFGNVTITVTDADNASATSAAFTWVIVAQPTVASPGNQTVSVGTPVNFALTTTCPNAPCTYTFANAPGGLTISNAGVVSGTVTGPAGNYPNVIVTVTDSDGATGNSGVFTLQVNPAPAITSPGNQTAQRGTAVSLDMSARASGGTGAYAYSANGLPSWLSINSSSGLITGTAPNANSTTSGITVTIVDASGASATTAAFAWNVTDLRNTFTDQFINQSTALNKNLGSNTSGGTGPYTYTASGLPSWVALNGSTGVVSGTSPSATGKTTGITITVTDSKGAQFTTAPFSWTVTATFTASLNNVGITKNANRGPGNFDGSGDSFSYESITSHSGPAAGATYVASGVTYTWPTTAGTGTADNVIASGQTIAYTLTGSTTLGFLASSAYGASSGTGTITYTDGSTQSFSLGAPDWWTGTPQAAFTTTSENNAGGTFNQANSVYYTNIAVTSTKTIASITLPTISSGGILHVFAIGSK